MTTHPLDLDPLQLLTVTQVAELLTMSTDAVYRLIAERRLAHVKIHPGKRGTVRISRAHLAAFIAARSNEPRQ